MEYPEVFFHLVLIADPSYTIAWDRPLMTHFT